jgi:hypothetical protein
MRVTVTESYRSHRRWTYPAELRDALAALGFAPRPDTPPAFVRAAVDELYKFELRRLRDRHRTGAIARADFADAVVKLRKKYWMLTLPERAWERICAAEPQE